MLGAELMLSKYWLINGCSIDQPIDKAHTRAVWKAGSTRQRREGGLQGEEPSPATSRQDDWRGAWDVDASRPGARATLSLHPLHGSRISVLHLSGEGGDSY